MSDSCVGVFVLLLLVLFSVVYYDKVDHTERIEEDLRIAQRELRALETSMVDIIQEEAERRESALQIKVEEKNRKRETTIARSFSLLQRAEVELVRAQEEAAAQISSTQLAAKEASEMRAELDEQKRDVEKMRHELEQERLLVAQELKEARRLIQVHEASDARDSDVLEESSAQEPSVEKKDVLVAVIVSSTGLAKARAIRAIVDTWAGRLGTNSVLFVSQTKEPLAPRIYGKPAYLHNDVFNSSFTEVVLPPEVFKLYAQDPARLELAQTYFAWQFMRNVYIEKKEWFMMVQERTFVMESNLLKTLADFASYDANYLGVLEYNLASQTYYVSGRAGIILSRTTLRSFGDTGLAECEVVFSNATESSHAYDDQVVNVDEKEARRQIRRREKALSSVARMPADLSLGKCVDRHLSTKPKSFGEQYALPLLTVLESNHTVLFEKPVTIPTKTSVELRVLHYLIRTLRTSV